RQTLRWFVFTDRGMYKPGEKVSLKGWMRQTSTGEGSELSDLAGAVPRVRYRVMGSRGNELATGTAEVSAAGGFDAEFALPDAANLGWASVQLTAEGQSFGGTGYRHSFQIQEFRRPEFEVSSSASEGPHMVGGSADIEAKASYYAGGALQGAPV